MKFLMANALQIAVLLLALCFVALTIRSLVRGS